MRIVLFSLVFLAACQQREAPTASPALPSAAPAAPATAAPSPCADCHPDETDAFARTGMGRSLAPAAQADVIEDYTHATVQEPASGFTYRALRDADGRLWQEERLIGDDAWVRRIEARYVIGSGNHTRSYLGLVDGELVQLPLTWYSKRRLWGMSPGYAKANQQRFGRVVEPPCLFCHNDLTALQPGTVATYVEPLAAGIGCDRCHGDGTAHVRLRTAGGGPAEGQPDPSIFNPAREPPLRQLQVCQQCHLQADTAVLHGTHRWDVFDVRWPLTDYVSVYQRVGEAGSHFGIASHGKRLAASRCAQASGDRLRCTTCHNPHTTATPETYRQACLSCHGEGATTHCPDSEAATTPCYRCHMAVGPTSDVPHVEFTDHFIRRRPSADDRSPANPSTTELADLVAGAAPPDGLEARLHQGLAHTAIWERNGDLRHLGEAVTRLQAVVAEAAPGLPGLATAHAALGRGLARMRRPGEALLAFNQALALGNPDPLFPDDRALTLMALGRLDEARTLLQTTLAEHPTVARWLRLGTILQQLGDLAAARTALESAAALTRFNPAPAAQAAALALRTGDRAAARRHFEAALTLDASHAPALLGLGTLHLEDGRPADALPPLTTLIARQPAGALPWSLRARARADLGQVDAALADYAQSIQRAPDRPEPLIAAVRLAQKSGRTAQARALLATAAERFPAHPDVQALQRAAQP